MDRDQPGDASPTKAQLTERIDRAWSELLAMIAPATEDDLTRPGEGGWSAKDHLAHLAAWERSLVALLEGKDRTAAALGSAVAGGGAGEASTNEINDAICQRYAAMPVADVLADLRLGHERVLAVIDPLDDDDLRRSYASFQPANPTAPDERVAGWVAGNTFEHYQEHMAAIRALLRPSSAT